MNFKRTMAIARIDSPTRLTVGYVVFGAAWIVTSDALVAFTSQQDAMAWFLEASKGLLFIFITAFILHRLVHRMISQHQGTAKELRESQQRLALVLEGGNQGYFDLNVGTGETIVNDIYARMLGYDPQTFRETFDSVCARVHPEDLETALGRYHRHLAGELDYHLVEYRLRTSDGGWRWILARGRVVERDAAGRPLRLVGTHTDITERKQAEAKTADALSLAKTVLQHAPVGVITYGPDGRTEMANACAARMVGANVADLLRQNFRELESWRKSGLLEAAERALATGHEVAINCPLLTSFQCSLHVEARFVPFEYQGGRHLLTLLADETVQRRTLENLHLLHAALKASPSAWVVTDAHGTIEWVNPAFTLMTGYSSAEAIGQTPRLLRSERQSPDFYRAFWETIQRGEVWSGELSNRRKDGTCYEEHMTVAPVRDDAGVIRHFVAIKNDITERKQLQEQLTRTQRLESIGMLASGIAHDLNNVLTPILLSGELLRAKYPEPGANKYVETVTSAAQRGAGIVRQVLTFARGLDGGEQTDVQPRYLLHDVLRLIEETFPRDIEIRCEAPKDVAAIRGDVTQLHQVILNLAVNARDAMPRGGRLTLSARNVFVDGSERVAFRQLKPGAYVMLAVADTGTGIAPAVMEHMFEPFYTTKPRGKGTGLGLSTVYGIVRSHGGAIDVQTNLGAGTAFELLFPAIHVAAAPAPEARPAALRGGGRRILVVDDEESIRSVTQRVLAKHGFTPVMARDGVDGLNAFLAGPRAFSAAIVDMMMPRMNGAELARNLRLAAPALPIVISTGLLNDGTDPAAATGLEGVRINAILAKPYMEDALLAALDRALAPMDGRSVA